MANVSKKTYSGPFFFVSFLSFHFGGRMLTFLFKSLPSTISFFIKSNQSLHFPSWMYVSTYSSMIRVLNQICSCPGLDKLCIARGFTFQSCFIRKIQFAYFYTHSTYVTTITMIIQSITEVFIIIPSVRSFSSICIKVIHNCLSRQLLNTSSQVWKENNLILRTK